MAFDQPRGRPPDMHRNKRCPRCLQPPGPRRLSRPAAAYSSRGLQIEGMLTTSSHTTSTRNWRCTQGFGSSGGWGFGVPWARQALPMEEGWIALAPESPPITGGTVDVRTAGWGAQTPMA